MDSDTVQDLKQFIEATVSQQLARSTDEIRGEMKQMGQEIRGEMKQMGQEIRQEMSQMREEIEINQNEILNAIGTTAGDHDEQLNDHEQRIVRLERA